MALKKGILDDYIKEREVQVVNFKTDKGSRYSHSRVFDEPESLKKVIKETQVSDPLSINVTSDPDNNADLNREVNGLIKSLSQGTITDDINQSSHMNLIQNNSSDKKNLTTDILTTGHKPNTNCTQKHYNQVTNGTHERINSPQRAHKPNTLLNTISTQNNEQKAILPRLNGIQKAIILTLYQNCKINGGNVTHELSLDYVAQASNVKKTSIKTSISRLKEKGCICVVDYKDGRGGWVKFQIMNQLFTELLQHDELLQLSPSLYQVFSNRNTQPTTQPNTNILSSSLSNINKTTTSLPEDWDEIDFNFLSEIGFTKAQIKQIFAKGLNNPDNVQQSIDHFSYMYIYEKERLKKYPNPLNVLMGVLIKGGIWVEKNYKSQNEIALAELKILKQNEAERMENLKKDLIQAEFEIWLNNLSESEKNEIEEIHSKKYFVNGLSKNTNKGLILKGYFINQINGNIK